MTQAQRLELICEAVRYCQRVASLGMPVSAYSKALREPVHFLWERREGSKEECAAYRSRAARGLSFRNRELVFDHSVPFRVLQEKLMKLQPVTPEAVRHLLERHSVVALITKEEDDRLNAAGLNRKMPPGWDKKNPLARYEAVGIELDPNQ